MSRSKYLAELPYSPVSGKACIACFDDPGLRKFVRRNAREKGCDFCTDAMAMRRRSCDLMVLVEHIHSCLLLEWEDPAEHLSYESAEGGYLGATVLDSYDLLDSELEVTSDELKRRIIGAFHGKQWCEKDPYWDREEDELFDDWLSFSKFVQHEVRYFFHQFTSRKEPFDSRDRHLSSVLGVIGRFIKGLKLVRTLPKGTPIFRARVSSSNEVFTSVTELGPPPKENASSSRMSPAGIPVFYGATDADTAATEVSYSPGETTSIGEFTTARALRILDLTLVPEMPSLFDEDRNHQRWLIRFFRNFISDLSRPIKPDKNEHLDYIPTQVFTEYIRHTMGGKHPVDGILYPSAAKSGGKCYVLFIKAEQCGDAAGGAETNESIPTLSLRTASVWYPQK